MEIVANIESVVTCTVGNAHRYVVARLRIDVTASDALLALTATAAREEKVILGYELVLHVD